MIGRTSKSMPLTADAQTLGNQMEIAPIVPSRRETVFVFEHRRPEIADQPARLRMHSTAPGNRPITTRHDLVFRAAEARLALRDQAAERR